MNCKGLKSKGAWPISRHALKAENREFSGGIESVHSKFELLRRKGATYIENARSHTAEGHQIPLYVNGSLASLEVCTSNSVNKRNIAGLAILRKYLCPLALQNERFLELPFPAPTIN
jgi:hypothetical protein